MHRHDTYSEESILKTISLISEKLRALSFTRSKRVSLVEIIRKTSEIVLLVNQQYPQLADQLIQHQIHFHLANLINSQKTCQPVVTQILQTLNIIIKDSHDSTFKSHFCLSGALNTVIQADINLNDDEILAYYVTLLRSVSFTLNSENICYFIDKETGTFALYSALARLYHFNDNMVQVAIKAIFLNIIKIDNQWTHKFISNCDDGTCFFTYILREIREKHDDTIRLVLDNPNPSSMVIEQINNILGDHIELLIFLNDVFNFHAEYINKKLTFLFHQRLTILTYCKFINLGNSKSSINAQRIAMAVSIVFLTHTISVIKYMPLLEQLAIILFYANTSIPLQLLTDLGIQGEIISDFKSPFAVLKANSEFFILPFLCLSMAIISNALIDPSVLKLTTIAKNWQQKHPIITSDETNSESSVERFIFNKIFLSNELPIPPESITLAFSLLESLAVDKDGKLILGENEAGKNSETENQNNLVRPYIDALTLSIKKMLFDSDTQLLSISEIVSGLSKKIDSEKLAARIVCDSKTIFYYDMPLSRENELVLPSEYKNYLLSHTMYKRLQHKSTLLKTAVSKLLHLHKISKVLERRKGNREDEPTFLSKWLGSDLRNREARGMPSKLQYLAADIDKLIPVVFYSQHNETRLANGSSTACKYSGSLNARTGASFSHSFTREPQSYSSARHELYRIKNLKQFELGPESKGLDLGYMYVTEGRFLVFLKNKPIVSDIRTKSTQNLGSLQKQPLGQGALSKNMEISTCNSTRNSINANTSTETAANTETPAIQTRNSAGFTGDYRQNIYYLPVLFVFDLVDLIIFPHYLEKVDQFSRFPNNYNVSSNSNTDTNANASANSINARVVSSGAATRTGSNNSANNMSSLNFFNRNNRLDRTANARIGGKIVPASEFAISLLSCYEQELEPNKRFDSFGSNIGGDSSNFYSTSNVGSVGAKHEFVTLWLEDRQLASDMYDYLNNLKFCCRQEAVLEILEMLG